MSLTSSVSHLHSVYHIIHNCTMTSSVSHPHTELTLQCIICRSHLVYHIDTLWITSYTTYCIVKDVSLISPESCCRWERHLRPIWDTSFHSCVKYDTLLTQMWCDTLYVIWQCRCDTLDVISQLCKIWYTAYTNVYHIIHKCKTTSSVSHLHCQMTSSVSHRHSVYHIIHNCKTTSSVSHRHCKLTSSVSHLHIVYHSIHTCKTTSSVSHRHCKLTSSLSHRHSVYHIIHTCKHTCIQSHLCDTCVLHPTQL